MPALAQEERAMLIIAHRGASGERPEHTLAAYERAIDQGADYIEPDLVPTKDGVLVARHENEISGTTDVAERPEFADRRSTKVIDGEQVTGWFTEDFTLAELRTLRARERLPQVRVANTRFDGLWQVPTLAEIIALVRAKEAETGRRIGLYPELKHSHYFASIGHDTAATLVGQLHAAGYRSADDPVFIQSFEADTLPRLNQMTELRLVQLVSAQGGPADRLGVTYADMLTAQGLADLARYADGIGAELALLLQDYGESTGLTDRAHAAGLLVHGWTVRQERVFAPLWARGSGEETAPINAACSNLIWEALARARVDGAFTDQPGWGRAVLNENRNYICL
nr:glycerophosphodiester phosphodiesterase family protein [Alteraurantiacibacter buctensis]